MSVLPGLYSKAVVSAGVAASTVAISGLSDGQLTGVEWVAVAVAFVVAFGAVWAVPNQPEGVRKYGKAITAAVIATLGALSVALLNGGGVDTAEILTMIVAFAGGLGFVLPVSNAASSDPVVEGKLVPVSLEDKQALVDNPNTPAQPGEFAENDEEAVVVLDEPQAAEDFGADEARR